MIIKALLILFSVTIWVYTIAVLANSDSGSLGVFFTDIMAVTWRGQFNVDFLCYVILAAFWIAWRNCFTPIGIAMAIIGGSLGMLFLAPYLLSNVIKKKGNLTLVFLGDQKADI
jgi:hypothetical protein